MNFLLFSQPVNNQEISVSTQQWLDNLPNLIEQPSKYVGGT